VLPTQFNLRAERLYARQKKHTAACPARLPAADLTAKSGPYCKVRKTATGPEVSGRPIRRPLKVGPHLRPASVTAPMKNGVAMSLNARIIF